MPTTRLPRIAFLILGLGACTSDLSSTAQQVVGNPLRGAIFTTIATGARVDANIYAAKEDVYLDGGPGMNAPPGAAALPEGNYYFQVTDPSGHVLLSSDAIACREIHVGAAGFITSVVTSGCEHATGTDQDYGGLGAITVQLMPYADTPNHGGEYKAWVTPVAAYIANGGFANAASKTDNFKVRVPPTTPPCCGNGILDDGEDCDDGNTADGDGCSSTCTFEETPPCCGNGQVEYGETCDDGNTTSGDGCSSVCTIETDTWDSTWDYPGQTSVTVQLQ